MNWSFSKYREFKKCQRKWFLNEKVGSRSNKDEFRREIYLLSQLESVDAWRGKIVDYTIGEFIIPRIKKRINQDEVLCFAKKVARARYDFAFTEKHKEIGIKKTEHDYDYSALYIVEYKDADLDLNLIFKKAWNEVEQALKNFLNNSELIEYLITADYLVRQRNLKFSFNDWTVQGVPDLIMFFKHRAPHIFDWKVHYFGTRSYNDQLFLYALALVRCNPHKDFLQYMSNHAATEIDLTEYQLLKNTIRNYKISFDDLESVCDDIADGIHLMQMKKCDADYKSLLIDDFEKTINIDSCRSCVFKRICKED